MRIQYKFSLAMIFIGIIVMLSSTVYFNSLNRKTILNKKLDNLRDLSYEAAHHMDIHINTFIEITRSFAEAPVLKNALLESNREFGSIPEANRIKKIESLNRQWMETDNIENPFIQKKLDNPEADFLQSQQEISPGQYGEIFLTNKFGLMIASTGKLTTLSHSQKYWWKSSYYNGKGRVFLDDRGFDTSVDGYVLGVVVPVYLEASIIGILKNNVNLKEILFKVINEFQSKYKVKIQIVRTNGLIVAEKDTEPLSTSLDDILIPSLKSKKTESKLIEIDNNRTLVAYSPIPLTLNTEEHSFGGNKNSIDHEKGNENESWHIVLSLDEDIIRTEAAKTTQLIIFAEALFIFLSSIIALIIGKWISLPAIRLVKVTERIGQGDLNSRAETGSRDEIGALSLSINKMSENLKRTMISRDKLTREIKLRKEAQKIAKLGSWELNLITNTLKWSEEIYSIFELDPGNILPSYELFLEHIHPDDREFVNISYTNSVKNKEPYNIEHRVLLKNNNIKIVNERCETFYSDKGEPIRSVGTIIDITQQKALEKKITNQLKEKEIILTETHHRIKNNFTSIGALLKMQAASLSNPEAVSAIQDAYGRVNSMSKLYENMLLEDNFTTSSVKEYLTKLIDDITHLLLDNKKIIINKQLTDFTLNSKELVSLGIIINELLTNILKYAFKERNTGIIQITLEKKKNDITLIIQDNGIGLPENFNMETQTGFGLMLIKMLTEQFNGNFSIENKEGTVSTLEFSI